MGRIICILQRMLKVGDKSDSEFRIIAENKRAETVQLQKSTKRGRPRKDNAAGQEETVKQGQGEGFSKLQSNIKSQSLHHASLVKRPKSKFEQQQSLRIALRNAAAPYIPIENRLKNCNALGSKHPYKRGSSHNESNGIALWKVGPINCKQS